ncbi:MAG: flagellar hook-length control protein FliK [Pirellulales bacterium]
MTTETVKAFSAPYRMTQLSGSTSLTRPLTSQSHSVITQAQSANTSTGDVTTGVLTGNEDIRAEPNRTGSSSELAQDHAGANSFRAAVPATPDSAGRGISRTDQILGKPTLNDEPYQPAQTMPSLPSLAVAPPLLETRGGLDQPSAQQVAPAEQVGAAILAEISVADRPRSVRLEVQLEPPELGKVWIRLVQTGDDLAVTIRAEHQHAVQSIESQLSTLRQTLDNAGVELRDLDISQHDHQSDQRTFQESQDPTDGRTSWNSALDKTEERSGSMEPLTSTTNRIDVIA